MEVIPVIDIRNGVVVRAVAGRRLEYRPLATPLASSCAPVDVARGLLSLHPFRNLYIADLDAIEGRGDNRATVLAVREALPRPRLWIDAGLRHGAEARRWLGLCGVSVVLGSESFADLPALGALRSNPRVALSLDFQAGRFLGARELLRDARLWPQDVIVMTLARVGSGEGPDIARVAAVVARAQGRRVYAAGGLRDADDLARLEKAGAAGALVASALHDGGLTSADLARAAPK